MIRISLSMIVLNSRDWSEIVWLPEISRFKNQPYNIGFIRKNPLECIGVSIFIFVLLFYTAHVFCIIRVWYMPYVMIL